MEHFFALCVSLLLQAMSYRNSELSGFITTMMMWIWAAVTALRLLYRWLTVWRHCHGPTSRLLAGHVTDDYLARALTLLSSGCLGYFGASVYYYWGDHEWSNLGFAILPVFIFVWASVRTIRGRIPFPSIESAGWDGDCLHVDMDDLSRIRRLFSAYGIPRGCYEVDDSGYLNLPRKLPRHLLHEHGIVYSDYPYIVEPAPGHLHEHNGHQSAS